MAKKTNYRDIEMDVLERLYHDRKALRLKAYNAKRRKKALRKGGTVKRASLEAGC